MVVSKTNQLKYGAILNYVIVFLHIALGLFYTPYMLKMLGKQEFGLYSLVASIIAYLTILDFGFANAVVRYTSRLRALNQKREQFEMFGMFILMYIVLSGIIVVLGGCLYCNTDLMFGGSMTAEEIYKAKIMILLLIANLAFTFPMSVFGGIITAYEDFVFSRTITILRLILTTLVMICLLKYGYKAITMVVVNTVFNVLALIINYLYCKIKLDIKVIFARFKWAIVAEVFVYSFWIFLNLIMDKIYWTTGQFVIGIYMGTAAVAIYALAIQFQNMYMQFSGAISSVFLPKITFIVTQSKDPKEVSDIFIKTGRIQYYVISLVLAGFIVFGFDFITLWLGKGFEEVYIVSLIFLVALTTPLIQTLGIVILQAKNQMKFRSLLYLGIALIGLIAQVIATQKFGILGCAISVAVCLFLGQGIIMNIYYYKVQKIDIPTFWTEILKMTIVPLGLGLSVLFLRQYIQIDTWLDFFVQTSIFSIMFILCSFLITINNYEKSLLLGFFKRRKGNLI